ncbi:hypothetical protein [Herbiconiux sp. L3-i23]|uniref:hypothetical protein n=1 Tax=Herbiconiux sp. L3-i23 TaxID=2905871 RepID=UPI00205F7EC3|nr:hypothetical protein [Herbiconiux sp. L3-i23]BDI22538.1 hypothetical protein L3i23_13140 [Herbiconiux sp. L3-i23]
MLRFLYFALVAVLVVGTTLLIPLASIREFQGAGWLFVTLCAGLAMALPPVTFGSQWQYWPSDPFRGDGATQFRRWLVIVTAIQIIGAAALITASVLGALPVWLVIAQVVGSAAATAALYAIANHLQKTALPPRDGGGTGVVRLSARRVARNVSFGAGIGLVIGVTIAVGLNFAVGDGNPGDLLDTGWFVLAIVMLAAGSSLFLPVYEGSQAVRATTHGSFGLSKRVQRRVLSGKNESLTPDELERADAYASGMQRLLPVQAWLFGLIFGAQFPLQLPRILSDDEPDLLNVISVSLLVVAIVFLVVAYGRYFRNLRRYVHEREGERTVGVATSTQ